MAIKFDDRIISNVADGILTTADQIFIGTGYDESILLISTKNNTLAISTQDENTIHADTRNIEEYKIKTVSQLQKALTGILDTIIESYNTNVHNVIAILGNHSSTDTNNILRYDNRYDYNTISLSTNVNNLSNEINSLSKNNIYILETPLDINEINNNSTNSYKGFFYSTRLPYNNIEIIPAKSLICINTHVDENIGISTNLSNYISILAMPYTPDQDATDLSAINAKLTSLEESNTQLTSKINLLEGTNSTLNEKVTSLEGANTKLNGKITTLESANSDLSGKVTTLEQNNTILKSENSTLKNQVHTLQHKLSLTTTVEL